jgi:hypothetical protein
MTVDKHVSGYEFWALKGRNFNNLVHFGFLAGNPGAPARSRANLLNINELQWPF